MKKLPSQGETAMSSEENATSPQFTTTKTAIKKFKILVVKNMDRCMLAQPIIENTKMTMRGDVLVPN